MRVRRAGEASYLTVKRGAGLKRTEIEIEIDTARFDALWPLTAGRRISKERYHVPLERGEAEVDVYAEGLADLIVAEVEFATEQEAAAFPSPDWFGEEVTGNRGFFNRNLATRGMPARSVPDGAVGAEKSRGPDESPGLTAMLERSETGEESGPGPSSRVSLHGRGTALSEALEDLDEQHDAAHLAELQERCLEYGAAAIAAAGSLFQGNRLLAQARPTRSGLAQLVSEEGIGREWMQASEPTAAWREAFAENDRQLTESSGPEAALFDHLITAAGLAADLYDWLERSG